MTITHRIQVFVVIFSPLFAYIHAQGFDDFKNGPLKFLPDMSPWTPDPKAEFRWCGCGGDRCEKLGICKTKGYNPVCCDNICRCVDSFLDEITSDKSRKCEMCEQTQDWKAIKVGKLCRNATREEYNCWKKHHGPIVFLPNFTVVYEYTY